MTRHQYGISALVSQTSFRGETSGDVTKCRLFSQANHYPDLGSTCDWLKQIFNQSEALLRSGQWHVISMEFLRSFLRRHFAGKPVVASRNVGCFLRLGGQWQNSELSTRVTFSSFHVLSRPHLTLRSLCCGSIDQFLYIKVHTWLRGLGE